MAIDHPDRIDRLGFLNVIPTLDQFQRMGTGPSLGYWPWYLLAHAAPFPERLLAECGVRLLPALAAPVRLAVSTISGTSPGCA